MFENFEEWFAIRNEHDDGDIWPGRLSFSEMKGIALETICFPNNGNPCEAPNCDTGTVTGYLDYQRPATIVEPWVQLRGGGSFGIDTPFVRAKSRMVASAVLKNIHLEDLNEKCFTALHMDMPAFSTWYAHKMGRTDYKFTEDKTLPNVSGKVDNSVCEQFTLNDETRVKIHSFVETREDENTTKVIQRTLLTCEFPDAIDYFAVQRIIGRINTMFLFFLAHRMAQNLYRLKTTHKREWNGRDEHITAELLFRPAFQSKTHHVKWHDALFVRHNSTSTTQDILNSTFESSNSLFYLMNMVLLMERPEKLSASNFSELLGCIEDFDISTFGSGSSKELKSARKSLRKVVQEYGFDEDLQTLDDLISKLPNRLTLTERLDRLQQIWAEKGFRGKPRSVEITKIRNDTSHGRGASLSSEDYRKVLWFTYYLCALSRFHIFRTLGIPERDIGFAFERMAFMYGKYAPRNEGNL